MGALAPAAGAVGSFLANPVVQTSLVIASAGASIFAQHRRGQAIEAGNKVAERQETLDARNREIARRKRLVSALAAQNVTSAAGGVRSFEGSAGNIIARDIETATLEQLSDTVGSQNRVETLRTSTDEVRRASLVGEIATGLDTAADLARIGSVGTGKTEAAKVAKRDRRIIGKEGDRRITK